MDDLSERILAALSLDGRISVTDLAEQLGAPRGSVSRHLQALLTGSGARVIGLVHPAVVGYPVMAHVSIDVSSPVKDLAALVSADSRVPFVSITAGQMSLVAEIRAKDQSDLQRCLDRIRALPGVSHTRTSLYTALAVDILSPSPIADVSLDELDLEIIEILRRDGRTSYSDMAVSLGVSTGTARTRALRVLDAGIVRIGLTWRPSSQERVTRLGLGIRIRGTAASMTETLKNFRGATFLASCIGQHDIIATIHGPDSVAVLDAVDDIRSLPDVLSVESWLHMKVVKEEH